MKAIVAFLLIAAVAVLAKDPTKPTWPKSFSTSAFVHKTDDRMPQFYRWFYDQTAKKDRLDGLMPWQDELYWGTIIFDHAAGKEYNAFFQEDAAWCFTNPINKTVPKPDFTKFKFAGSAIVSYQPCYMWVYDSAEAFVQYYDRRDTRQPVRIDTDYRGRAETWTFSEFDAGTEDSSIFELPAEIKAICN